MKRDLQGYLASIVESSEDAIISKSMKGNIVYWNKGAERIYGYTSNEVLGKSINILTPNKIDEHKEILEKYRRGEKLAHYETQRTTKDGSLINVFLTISPIYDEKKRIIGFSTIARDITRDFIERKKSEFKFKGLLESAPDAIVIVNSEGKIQLVNSQTEKLFGYNRAEIIGRELEILIPSRFKHAHLKNRKVFFADPKARAMGAGLDLVGQNKEGKEFPVEISLSPLETEDGLLISAAIRDITKQKQASQYARSLIEASLDPLVTINADGKITDVNEASEKVTGVPRKKLIGTDFSDYFTEPDKAQDGYRQVFDKGFVADYPLTIKHESGKLTDVLYNASVYKDHKGNVLGVFAAARDLTDRKKAEQVLAERERAEHSEKIKEQFLANMSHEIRTPMNAIIGFTDVLAKTKLSSNQQQYLHSIKTSGENLLVIINDILDYSKIEEGIIRFEKVSISIQQMLDSLRVMMAAKAEAKGINLIFRSDQNVPDAVIGDPMRLSQIILNLVSNAIKFTEKGSVIVNAKIKEERSDVLILEFEVSDTGIGIPEDKWQTIFERFQQAESHTARHYGGTGLGLSIVKNLVELQGGTISVSSEWAKGSVFTFTLPFQKADEKVQAQKIKARKVNRSVTEGKKFVHLKVLLAEDNKMNQILMSVILANMGIDADIVGNGKLAIEKLEENSYDVILMDMQMPEMDGYQATQYIRKTLKYSIPIIAITAHAMPGEKEKCLTLGMNEYISKPFREDKLYNIILSVLHPETSGEDVNEIRQASALVGSTQTFDIEFLKKHSHNNMSFVKEMLEIFIEEVPAEVALIAGAIEMGDYGMIKTFSHKLRSSVQSLNMGEEFEQILATIEIKATSDLDMSGIKKLFSKFELMAKRAITQAQNELLKLA